METPAQEAAALRHHSHVTPMPLHLSELPVDHQQTHISPCSIALPRVPGVARGESAEILNNTASVFFDVRVVDVAAVPITVCRLAPCDWLICRHDGQEVWSFRR